MSNYSNSNAHDSTQTDDSPKKSTALGPPTEESEETSWQMRQTVADERRQHLLRSLAEHGGSLSVAELAELVTDLKKSGEREEPRPVVVQRERMRLRRVDLPQLHEAGFVVYDADDSSVTLPNSPEREFTPVETNDDD